MLRDSPPRKQYVCPRNAPPRVVPVSTSIEPSYSVFPTYVIVTNGVFFFFIFCLLCSVADQFYRLVCVAFLILDRYSDLVNLMAAAEVAAALGTSAGGAQSPSDPAGGAQSEPSFTNGRPHSGRGQTMLPRSRSGTPSPPRTRSGGVPSASAPPIPQQPPRRR